MSRIHCAVLCQGGLSRLVGFGLNYFHCVQTQSTPEGQGRSTESCSLGLVPLFPGVISWDLGCGNAGFLCGLLQAIAW